MLLRSRCRRSALKSMNSETKAETQSYSTLYVKFNRGRTSDSFVNRNSRVTFRSSTNSPDHDQRFVEGFLIVR
jgi:hypothetical protein